MTTPRDSVTGQHLGLLLDAVEFVEHVDPRSASARELQALLDAGFVPTDRSRTRHAVASVLVVTTDGRVLLARNKHGWGTAGGHIDPQDVSIRAAAIREAEEEVGLVLEETDLAPLAFLADPTETRPGHAHLDFCYLHWAASSVPVRPGSDVTEATWFPLTGLPVVNAHIGALVDAVRRAIDDDR